MTKFRQSQLKEIAGVKVVSKTDLNVSKKYNSDGTVEDVDLPKTNVVKWDLGNDEWACVRPSGTEPKLKIYVSTNAGDKQTAAEKNLKIMTAISEMI